MDAPYHAAAGGVERLVTIPHPAFTPAPTPIATIE
jgi:hypothetical protein